MPGTRLAPEGLAFYLPPTLLAAGPPGQVIWSRQLAGAAALPGAAENLLVLYHSTTLAGQDIAVSGTISIPAGRPPAAGWPVLSWAHGTAGVADICAPSRDAPGHPCHIYNQLADAALNQWVERGWAVTKTDYEGLGTPARTRTWRGRPRHAAPPTSSSPPASSGRALAGAGSWPATPRAATPLCSPPAWRPPGPPAST